MKIIPLVCPLGGKALEDALLDLDAVALDPEKAGSAEEMELADYLAEKSFLQKRNIARKRKYEFLLWLSGRTDLKSAFGYLNPKGRRILLVVFSGDAKGIIKALGAKEIKLKMKKESSPLDLERISLSRIKN